MNTVFLGTTASYYGALSLNPHLGPHLPPPLNLTESHIAGWGLKVGSKSGETETHWYMPFRALWRTSHIKGNQQIAVQPPFWLLRFNSHCYCSFPAYLCDLRCWTYLSKVQSLRNLNGILRPESAYRSQERMDRTLYFF